MLSEYLSEIQTAQSHTQRAYVMSLDLLARHQSCANWVTVQEGKAEVIANEEGDRQIPSFLSYIEGEEYHGTQAKSQLVRNSRNTVAYFRDYLGQEYGLGES